MAGFWPFAAGSGTPNIGVPVGVHAAHGTVFCADPVFWFMSRLIENPSAFILGRPGLGKSTLIRKLLIGLRAKGAIPLVLSDLRPDYTDLMGKDLLDGQVIRVGPGRDHLNPVSLGPLRLRLSELPETLHRPDGTVSRFRTEVLADLSKRRANLIRGLCELTRGSELQDFELTLLARGLALLDEQFTDEPEPVIGDLRKLIQSRPAHLREAAQSGDSPLADDKYDARALSLIDALMSLESAGPYGDMFSEQTSINLDPFRPASFDMSAVRDDPDPRAQAGLQLLCWTFGSSAVSSAKALSEAGLERSRFFVVVMDELWLVLDASRFMVDRINELSRLNRARMIVQILCTHTMKDLELGDEATSKKARGFVERAGMVFLGGLAQDEMGSLQKVFEMSESEQRTITNWSMKGRVNPKTSVVDAPPGRGMFLVKTGTTPGDAFRVVLTEAERPASNTNRAWEDLRASMRGGPGASGHAGSEQGTSAAGEPAA